jgi:acyl-CoA reductase-like NAD-dependent aldehyde dehydrogenase
MSSVYEVINPATEKVVKRIELADQAATDAAIERAHTAFETWRHVAPGDRANMLRSFASVVSAHREELAALEIENSGHTRGNALWEADNVANVLNYYSAAPERLFGKQIPVPNGIDITFKEPLGVIGVIVTWNFPMPIASWGFAAALAAGNTVVLKPAELTPMTAVRLGELALDAGIPEGVLNVIVGKGSVVGARFVSNPTVRKISFTGSTAVGKSIMAGCADQVKRVTLELGGKSANVIFADSDVERAAAAAPGAVFDNSGQDCCARSRILVQKSAFDRFMEGFEKSVKAYRVEDPNLDSSQMGPLISKKQLETVQSFLNDKDDTVAFAGSAPSGPGYWMPPTVLMPKSVSARTWQEEIFGPVAVALSFDTADEALAMTNGLGFGLVAGVYSRDISRALAFARDVEAGSVWINGWFIGGVQAPTGGIKDSGVGRERGLPGIRNYLSVKNIGIRL